MTVSVAEAKERLTELLAKVGAGERVVIERHGKAVAEICAPQKRNKPNFEAMKGVITVIDPDWDRPQEDIEAWMRGEL